MRIQGTLAAVVFAAAAVAATAATAQSPAYPSSYPEDYDKIVEASRQENGLVIYSNMAEYNWRPLIAGFNKHYPWISVESLDLGSGTVHTRWAAEAGSNSRTADILVSGAIDRWIQHGLDGDMLDYDSPELAALPDFAEAYDGVYVLSVDPLILSYNAAILDKGQQPTGLRSLVELAKADPATFKGRITTYDAANNAFGLAAWWAIMDDLGEDGWKLLSELGPMLRVETSGGPMNEKISTGEYVAGFAVSGITIFPRLKQPGGEILGFRFPDDGTPMMYRGMGIPKGAANPNSAKLFLDYALSHEGQTLLGQGGVTPYRDDVDEKEVPYYTYQAIADLVGKDNIIAVDFDKRMLEQTDEFIARWNRALSGK